MLARSPLAFVVVAALACSSPPADPLPPPVKPPPASTTQRPPHPNMASAAWGERVANELATTLGNVVDGDAKLLLSDARTKLLSLDPGSEKQARDLALRSWKRAADDAGRGAALATVALALVLDPTVDGYAERLTDAAGIAIYAGTVDASDSIGQCSRAVVGAAAGSVRQARALIKLVDETPKVGDDVRGWLAIARDSTRDGSDAFFDDAKKGLASKPDNIRLHALYADHLLELGFVDDAIASLGKRNEAPLVLLQGRAQLERGEPGGAIALLQPLAERLVAVDEPRRAEALFWLALAQLDGAAEGADLSSSKATIAALEPRPGWRKETLLLNAIVAAHEGRFEDAKKILTPLTNGTPTSTVVIERRITAEMLALCSVRTKDAACVEKQIRRLGVLDVDAGRFARARSAVLTVDGVPSGNAAELATESSLMAGGGPLGDVVTLRKLVSVRRAFASKAPSLAAGVVDELAKNPTLRLARAFKMRLARDPPETARLAAAAVTGLGPPLAESDLVDVIGGLAAHKTKNSESLIALFDKDARPAVQQAVALARSDLKDPDSRKKRMATERGDVVDDHDHGPVPGGVAP